MPGLLRKPQGTLYVVLAALAAVSAWLLLPFAGVAWANFHLPTPRRAARAAARAARCVVAVVARGGGARDGDTAGGGVAPEAGLGALAACPVALNDTFRALDAAGRGPPVVEGAVSFAATKFYCYEEEPFVEVACCSTM